MSDLLDLAVVIPTFNERRNVPVLIAKLDQALKDVAWEAIFVDDDSPDGTADAARELARVDRRVRVIQRIGRRGLSSACIEGMLATAAPLVAVAMFGTTAAAWPSSTAAVPQAPPALTASALSDRYTAEARAIKTAERAAIRHRDSQLASALASLAPRQVLFFNPDGQGVAAMVIGNLATATRVAILVPGSDTTLATFFSRGPASPGGGAEALETSLLAGAEQATPLESGLEEASVQVIDGKKRINRQARQVAKASPNLFNSGYFVLSALDGSPPGTRTAVAETIDLDRGGQAASILIISDYSFNTPGSVALNKKLDKDAKKLASDSGLQTGVAGGAAQLNDYSKVTRERIPWVVAAITIVTFLVLILVLRAIPLAAIAVALNLATVAVAFGILTLLFEVPEDWPLGGHTYVDAVGATMIFGVVFGLSIDYAVFLLSRMREHYDEGNDNEAAVRYGLEKTARVITGPAAIEIEPVAVHRPTARARSFGSCAHD